MRSSFKSRTAISIWESLWMRTQNSAKSMAPSELMSMRRMSSSTSPSSRFKCRAASALIKPARVIRGSPPSLLSANLSNSPRNAFWSMSRNAVRVCSISPPASADDMAACSLMPWVTELCLAKLCPDP